MRILPRLTLSNLKPLRLRLRRVRRNISVAHVTLIIELLFFGAVVILALTGKSSAWIDRFGRRADLIVLMILLALGALLHSLVKRHLVPRLEHYFSPVSYDEHRILFDLGQEARAATDVDHLFRSIASRIEETFQAEDVSIFVRDEKSDAYLCRVSSLRNRANDVEAGSQLPVALARNAFVVRRLKGLLTPMETGPQEWNAWRRAFESASPELRQSREREIVLLEQIKARLLLQIRIKDQLVGILSLGQSRVRHQFSTADKEMLISIAGQLAFVIENSRLTERMVAEERLRRELALAAEVQRRLLPAHPPESVSFELAGFCQPARGVGGDYYDFIAFDNQQLGIAIADVAGKGISAALLMSTVQATLRSLSAGRTQTNDSLTDMVATLNRLLCNSTGRANYVTFFYAQFDQTTQRLAYVNAGHNPPFLLRANQTNDFRSLSSGGMFIGMFDHCTYEQETVQMQAGDVLIAFTDGLPEALNANSEEFDESRIREALAATALLPVNDIRDEIVRRVQEWCAGVPQYDDLTFIVMKVK